MGIIDKVRCRLIDLIELRMHMMLRDILDLDRAEGAKSYVKCHLRDIHTHIPHLLQKLRRKMQPGRRRSADPSYFA